MWWRTDRLCVGSEGVCSLRHHLWGMEALILRASTSTHSALKANCFPSFRNFANSALDFSAALAVASSSRRIRAAWQFVQVEYHRVWASKIHSHAANTQIMPHKMCLELRDTSTKMARRYSYICSSVKVRTGGNFGKHSKPTMSCCCTHVEIALWRRIDSPEKHHFHATQLSFGSALRALSSLVPTVKFKASTPEPRATKRLTPTPTHICNHRRDRFAAITRYVID